MEEWNMAPIDVKELEEKGIDVGTQPRTSRIGAVLELLNSKPRKAYTQKEVAEVLKMGSTHANQILRGLVDKEKAIRKVVDQDGKSRIYYAGK